MSLLHLICHYYILVSPPHPLCHYYIFYVTTTSLVSPLHPLCHHYIPYVTTTSFMSQLHLYVTTTSLISPLHLLCHHYISDSACSWWFNSDPWTIGRPGDGIVEVNLSGRLPLTLSNSAIKKHLSLLHLWCQNFISSVFTGSNLFFFKDGILNFPLLILS